MGVVLIEQKEHRMAAIATIKEALKKSLVDGAESNRLWRHWGEKGVGRKGVYKAAAVELESSELKISR